MGIVLCGKCLCSVFSGDIRLTKFHTIMIVLHDFAGVSHNISALKTNPLWPERAQG